MLSHKYGKTNYLEVQACLIPYEFDYVCQETLLILTYIPNVDCETTLIHLWGHPHNSSTPISLSATHRSNAPAVWLQPLFRDSKTALFGAPTSGTHSTSHAYPMYQLTHGRAGWPGKLWASGDYHETTARKSAHSRYLSRALLRHHLW